MSKKLLKNPVLYAGAAMLVDAPFVYSIGDAFNIVMFTLMFLLFMFYIRILYKKYKKEKTEQQPLEQTFPFIFWPVYFSNIRSLYPLDSTINIVCFAIRMLLLAVCLFLITINLIKLIKEEKAAKKAKLQAENAKTEKENTPTTSPKIS
jgi:flagellar biosynthesis/type III secretory pathway M-ring protein FliF/YscJ